MGERHDYYTKCYVFTIGRTKKVYLKVTLLSEFEEETSHLSAMTGEDPDRVTSSKSVVKGKRARQIVERIQCPYNSSEEQSIGSNMCTLDLSSIV